jgi:hypothetical protein
MSLPIQPSNKISMSFSPCLTRKANRHNKTKTVKVCGLIRGRGEQKILGDLELDNKAEGPIIRNQPVITSFKVISEIQYPSYL